MTTRSWELKSLFARLAKTLAEHRLPLLAEAIALAEAQGDEDSLYSLRRALLRSAILADDPATGIAAFSTALAQHTQDRGRFPRSPDELNRFPLDVEHTFAILPALETPTISRAQIEQLLASLESLLRTEGLPLHQLTYMRLVVARRLRDFARLPDVIESAKRIPPGALPCDGCLNLVIANAQLNLGDTFGALHLLSQELAEPQCQNHHNHEGLMAAMVVPLLQLQRAELAEQYFCRARDKAWSWALLRADIAGPLLTAAALTNQLAYGLDLLERRIPDLTGFANNHAIRIGFHTGAALLLDRAARAGLGQRPVRDFSGLLTAEGIGGPNPLVADLVEPFWTAAQKTSAAFDLRAGNTARIDWLTAQKALREASYVFDIRPRQAEPGEPSHFPEPASAWDQVIRAQQHYWLGEFELCQHASQAALADDQAQPEARILAMDYRLRAAAQAAQLSAEVTTVAQLPLPQRASLEAATGQYLDSLRANHQYGLAAVGQRWGLARLDQAAAPIATSRALLTEFAAGAPGVAELNYALARSLLDHGDHQAAVRLAHDAFSAYDQASDPLWDSRFRCATLTASTTDPQATELLTEVSLQAGPILQALAHLNLAQWAIENGILLDAAADAHAAGQQLLALDARGQAAQAYQLRGDALERLASPIEAAAAIRQALAITESLEDHDRSGLRLRLGRLSLQLGDSRAAIDQLRQADAEMLQAGVDQASAEALDCARWLALAWADEGEFDTAIVLLTTAGAQAPRWWSAVLAETRSLILHAIGESESAVADALAASDAYQACSDDEGHYRTLGAAAQILADAGRRGDAIKLLRPVVESSEAAAAVLGDLLNRLAD